MNTLSQFQPDWISTPGQTISDILEERGISTNLFAKKMNSSNEFVSGLLKGNEHISDEIALRLENILGASSRFWLNRENQYREYLLKLETIQAENWIKSLPIKDMIDYGWIKKSKDIPSECLKFFNVANVSDWHVQQQQLVEVTRFRTSKAFESQLGSTAVWLRQGEIQASRIKCKPWNPELLENTLIKIKKLSRLKKPGDFLPDLRKACAECGISLAIVRTPSGCRASGATKFLSDDRAMLLLSFRYLSDDQFWFTFFHEAGHLLLHGNEQVFIEEFKWNDIDDQEERDANFFAGEMLIPTELLSELKILQRNKRQIISFAQKAGVSPGIVIGQMQHHGIIKHSYLNSYKRRYNWDEIMTHQFSHQNAEID